MSIIQIVQDISKKITDITTNVEKIKTSQSSSKREIIDDLTKIKEKIKAMKKSCDEEKKNLEAEIEAYKTLIKSMSDEILIHMNVLVAELDKKFTKRFQAFEAAQELVGPTGKVGQPS